jgi:hypothetical protein
MVRKSTRRGLAAVIFAMILQFGVLVQMWFMAPLIARTLGASAYAIALLITSVTFAIYLYIAEDDTFRGERQAVASRERWDASARPPHDR